jgi:hypothetical protein
MSECFFLLDDAAPITFDVGSPVAFTVKHSDLLWLLWFG